jgi:hypothetical protein
MTTRFYAIVRGEFQDIPDGETKYGPFGTRKEAQWAAEREMNAAVELFGEGDTRSRISCYVVQR